MVHDGDGGARGHRTFYVAALGAGSVGGAMRQTGVFVSLAAGGGILFAGVLALLPDGSPRLQRGVVLAYVAFLAVAWWVARARTRVDVGPDGMRLTRFGTSRFIPVAAILGTSTSEHAITVFLDEALVGQPQITLVSRARRATDPTYRTPDPELRELAGCLSSAIDAFGGTRGRAQGGSPRTSA